ncbi:MAG: cupredoxin domain-containing protein [Dehalococcoidia bacterium]
MGKPYYARIALLGIAVYLFIEAVILVVTLVYEPSEAWYPFLVGGLALAGGATIYFVHPWGLLVGLMGGLFGILFSMDSIGENLSSPDSFLDFAYRPVFWLAGTILVLTGSIGGLVQHFRGYTGASGPGVVTKAAIGLLGVVAGLSLYSAILTVAGIDHVSRADKEGATMLTASVWRFDREVLAAASGGTTKIVVKNNDLNLHTFTVDSLDIDVKVGPRGERLVLLDSPRAGAYEFRCRITGHERMRGTLRVE